MTGWLQGLLASFLVVATPAPEPVLVGPASGNAYLSEAAVIDVLTPLVLKWEGTKTEAYLDIVGVPTICTGHIEGVYLGMVKTAAECEEMLRVDLLAYHRALLPAFTPDTRATRLHAKRHAAFDDLAYNVGISGTAKSTAMRRLNAGEVRGACEAIGWFNKAGGRVIRGLINRRSDDTALCLEGL